MHCQALTVCQSMVVYPLYYFGPLDAEVLLFYSVWYLVLGLVLRSYPAFGKEVVNCMFWLCYLFALPFGIEGRLRSLIVAFTELNFFIVFFFFFLFQRMLISKNQGHLFKASLI